MRIVGPALDERAQCEEVLRSLPQWFGIEAALLEYAREAEARQNFVARSNGGVVGFVTMHVHNAATLELGCIAIVPAFHGYGVGTRLCATVEAWWAARGGRLIQVKTLGPTKASAAYARTRQFYAARGFLPVEEFANLWPGNPCLLLVKPLPTNAAAYAQTVSIPT